MCSTTAELTVIVPSASPFMSQMRPRGESASIWPSGPYVGHVGRQKPQCVQASMSSRSIMPGRALPGCARGARGGRDRRSIDLAPRARANLVPDLVACALPADELARCAELELDRRGTAFEHHRQPLVGHVEGARHERRAEDRLPLGLAVARDGRDERRRRVGQRVQAQAGAADGAQRAARAAEAACRGRSRRRSSPPSRPSSRRARRRARPSRRAGDRASARSGGCAARAGRPRRIRRSSDRPAGRARASGRAPPARPEAPRRAVIPASDGAREILRPRARGCGQRRSARPSLSRGC